jgi:hypothetical protein
MLLSLFFNNDSLGAMDLYLENHLGLCPISSFFSRFFGMGNILDSWCIPGAFLFVDDVFLFDAGMHHFPL